MFISLLLLSLTASLSLASKDIQVVNKCNTRLFVKNEGGNTGSFNLEHGQSRTFQVREDDPRPRVWAHKGCDRNGNNCETTEGYVTLAEMHWDENTGMRGFTWYDISHVDGYNLPMTMQPFNPGAGGNCVTVGCNFNIDRDCPQSSKVMNRGRAVACRNNNRDTITDYSRSIKRMCPNTYSWSKDDQDGTKACRPGNNGLRVIFC